MAHDDVRTVAAEVGRHLLVAIDNAISNDPAPVDLKALADAYGQVASHLPKGQQYQNK